MRSTLFPPPELSCTTESSAGAGKSGVVGVDVFAAPGKPKAWTGEIQVHGIKWRLVDRAGAAETPQMYERINPAGAALPKL